MILFSLRFPQLPFPFPPRPRTPPYLKHLLEMHLDGRFLPKFLESFLPRLKHVLYFLRQRAHT